MKTRQQRAKSQTQARQILNKKNKKQQRQNRKRDRDKNNTR